jgi:hypothetical protein
MKHLLRTLLSLAVLLAVVASCKQTGKKESSMVATAQEAPSDIRLYTLDGGTVQVNNLELFAQDSV